MSTALVLAGVAVPLVVLLALCVPATARAALALAPWAALPALAAAFLAAPGHVALDWFMLGATLGLDGTRRVFLALAAGLWLAAGLYAGAYHAGDPRRRRMFAFFLAAMAANLGLVVALDAVTFYLAFVVMSLAAYGLVVHADTPEARRAGRVYIVMVIVGEAMILPGLWIAVAGAETTLLADIARASATAHAAPLVLLVLGFGVKAGLVPLHVWLPLAHPAAPTPASAVLSGAIIKAGVLAWLVFLPVGHASLSGIGGLLVATGILNAFYGAAAGVVQTRPKTVLAYSSVSQMGLIAMALGAGLTDARLWPAALAAVAACALHHGLAKGALFLGVGVVEHAGRHRRAALALLLVPALALAGAPFTTGFAAKLALKDVLSDLPAAVALLATLAAAGTTLLMARCLWLLRQGAAEDGTAGPGLWLPFAALAACGPALPWLPGVLALDPAYALDPAALFEALWPALLALALAAAALALRPRLPAIPEGDLLAPASRALRTARRLARRAVRPLAAAASSAGARAGARLDAWRAAAAGTARGGETVLARPAIAGLALVVLVLALGFVLAG